MVWPTIGRGRALRGWRVGIAYVANFHSFSLIVRQAAALFSAAQWHRRCLARGL